MIEFYLNGQPQTVENADPNLSILEWLRTKMRLTGTKEGCASGDCGACTVVTGTPVISKSGNPKGMEYQAVNSCITLMGSLHGKHLVTVDALQEAPGHPVQQAMMEHHGAQCGFCTPGFIMSLFALHTRQEGKAADDHTLLEALSGNLCRCTGYRPIMDAGRQAMVQTWSPEPAKTLQGKSGEGVANSLKDSFKDKGVLKALTEMGSRPSSFTAPGGRRYDAPTSLKDMRELRKRFPDSRLVAGSTDLALEITQQLKTLDHLVSIERVPELHTLSSDSHGLVIGAGVTYEHFRKPLSKLWPDFDAMLGRLGSVQIRNRGTLGGNIGNASPIGDMPPPLIALDATLVLDGPKGERELPIERFFLGYKKTDLQPGEFVRSVRVPAPAQNQRLFIYKISKRLDDDISAVLGAFRLTVIDGIVSDCRLAFGGMAATPARAKAAEAALSGQPWNDDSVSRAITALAGDFTPMSDVRASASYRLQVAGNLLRRALLASATDSPHSSPELLVTDFRVTDHA